MLSEAACALERLATERRKVSSNLLYLDAADRWGPPDAREEVARELSQLEARHAGITKALTKLIVQSLKHQPDAVAEWAQARVVLLEAYIAACAAKETDGKQSTERYVAEGEREAWRTLAGGASDLVNENTFYVAVDIVMFERLFGFSPR